jgi:hypothetical protein
MIGQQARDHERLNLLEQVLVAEGVLPPDWREASRKAETPEELREAVRSARDGNGPPEWAGNGNGNGGGPGGGA